MLKRVRYDTEQTAQILANARKQSGMTGTTLYLIGCMMRAIRSRPGCLILESALGRQ